MSDRTDSWKAPHLGPGAFVIREPSDNFVSLHKTTGVGKTEGIGDVTSTARGSGARYNSGKPPMHLIPLKLIAESFIDPEAFPAPVVVSALEAVGDFQESGDALALHEALFVLSAHWEDCARVFDYGRKKYAAWNWAKGMSWSIPVACIGRHALAMLRGEDNDPESGLPHIGHILCNIVMLAMFVDTFPEGNDLPPPELFKPKADA